MKKITTKQKTLLENTTVIKVQVGVQLSDSIHLSSCRLLLVNWSTGVDVCLLVCVSRQFLKQWTQKLVVNVKGFTYKTYNVLLENSPTRGIRPYDSQLLHACLELMQPILLFCDLMEGEVFSKPPQQRITNSEILVASDQKLGPRSLSAARSPSD